MTNSPKPKSPNTTKPINDTKSKDTKSKDTKTKDKVRNSIKNNDNKKKSPSTMNSKRKIKGILRPPKWKSNKKRRIRFNNTVRVREFFKDDNEKHCVINPLPQILFKQLSVAHRRLFDIINKHSAHNILQCVGIDEPVKVFDNRLGWWKDRSALLLLNKLKEKDFLHRFIKAFDANVERNLNVGEMKGVIMTNGRFTVKCYKVIRIR